ncbi:MAG: YidH family protein [Pseudomonadota bacterium]
MSYLDDPRVFFAAERTLLAWTRTSLTLMAFGFVIERFGLFLRMVAPDAAAPLARGVSFWVGIGFILLGVGVALSSIVQYRRVLSLLKPAEIPERYWTGAAVVTNLALAVLGTAMTVYLFTS